MPPPAVALADLVAVGALVALVATAYRHPPAGREAAVALVALLVTVSLAVPSGLVEAGVLTAAVRRLAPVVLFLVGILVVADVCARSGLFAAAGRRVEAFGSGRPVRLLLGVFALAAVVTVVLSLDATAVLLTPVVVTAAARAGASSRPGSFACLRMANSASVLLPVSNLTNLLALPDLDLSFAGFAVRMAPVLLVVLVLEYAALRLFFRHELAPDVMTPDDPEPPAPVPCVPVVTVLAMLAGFVVASSAGIEPAYVSGAAALVLVCWARARGLLGAREVVAAAHPSFALFVLALGVVVAAISAGVLGDVLGALVPTSTPTWAGLLGVAVLATVTANLVTNLSATLLVVPLVAPLGDTAILAALLGLNIGSGLTYSGSLANLLWRRSLSGLGEQVTMREFHVYSLLVTPVVLLAAVLTLAATG